jgi:type I restriction enzyme M protein
VRQDKNMGFLEEKHIQRIYQAFRQFEDEDDLAKVLTLADVEAQKFNLAISRYIRPERHEAAVGEFGAALEDWRTGSNALSESMNQLFATLEGGKS